MDIFLPFMKHSSSEKSMALIAYTATGLTVSFQSCAIRVRLWFYFVSIHVMWIKLLMC